MFPQGSSFDASDYQAALRKAKNLFILAHRELRTSQKTLAVVKNLNHALDPLRADLGR